MKRSPRVASGLVPFQKLKTVFPKVLDFVSNTEQTSEFFRAFKIKSLFDPADVLHIDTSAAETISPDAGLVLIAELMRSAHHSPNCDLRGSPSKNPAIHEFLGKIGYYQYFSGIHWSDSKKSSKFFLVHRTGCTVDQLVGKEIIEHFEPVAHWQKTNTSTLYNAIVECLTNVLFHAYPDGFTDPCLRNQWWLLASRDTTTREISFCFFDQGIGIPNTIRTRIPDQLPLIAPTDSEIIIKAVMEGKYSRTRKLTRGNGLPALKKFIDQAEKGQLTIVTHKSKCIFSHGAEPVAETLTTPLGGTLIIWTIKA